MEERYFEWASKPHTRSGLMVSESRLNNIVGSKWCSGYSSVYSFSKEDADKITLAKSSVGMDRYEVGSSRIVVDIDGGADQLKGVEDILTNRGVGYSVWFSGSKGYHVIIPTEYRQSCDLPYSHLSYLKSIGVDCDETLYQHGRLLSLPGRSHPKTRRVKCFMHNRSGSMPEFDIVQKPLFEYNEGVAITDMGWSETMLSIADLAHNEPDQGRRHVQLWGLGKDLVRCGLKDATILDLLQTLMKSWENPKDESDIIKIVQMSRRQA